MENEYAKQDARQNGIVKVFVSKGARGFATAVTGFGKTELGKKVIKKMHERVPTRTCHVIVPTIPLKSQWEESLARDEIQHTTVYVVNGYVDKFLVGEIQPPSLYIFDEVHNYASESAEHHSQVFDFAEDKFLLCLTATPTKRIKDFLISKGISHVGHVSEEEAERENYTAKSYLYNWAIPLPERLREEYDTQTRIIKHNMAVFDHNYGLAMLCISAKGNAEAQVVANNLGISVADVKKSANMLNYAVGVRKLLLYEAKEKIEAVKKLVEKFPMKTIAFSQSTKFADSLQVALGNKCRSFHSNQGTEYRVGSKVVAKAIKKKSRQRGKKDTFFVDLETGEQYTPDQAKVIYSHAKKVGGATINKEAMELFGNPDSNVLVLSTAEALDEGFDDKRVMCGYITSGTSVDLKRVQRHGRIKRKNGLKQALIVTIYFEGTKDEDWLKSSMGDKEVKTVYSIDEIEYDATVPNPELNFKETE